MTLAHLSAGVYPDCEPAWWLHTARALNHNLRCQAMAFSKHTPASVKKQSVRPKTVLSPEQEQEFLRHIDDLRRLEAASNNIRAATAEVFKRLSRLGVPIGAVSAAGEWVN